MFATVTPFARLSSKVKVNFCLHIMITVCTVFSEISVEFNVNVCSQNKTFYFHILAEVRLWS